MSQSSSWPLHVSPGGAQASQLHEALQVRVPTELHDVEQVPEDPAGQAKPLSAVPSQSSSCPLHVSAGAVQEPQVQLALHPRRPAEPQVVEHEPVAPGAQAKPSSGVVSQSSSMPLHDSTGGVQAPPVGGVQPSVQAPAPVVPQVVVQTVERPTAQAKSSSVEPSQSSSTPLQDSTVDDGAQEYSQPGAPSRSW